MAVRLTKEQIADLVGPAATSLGEEMQRASDEQLHRVIDWLCGEAQMANWDIADSGERIRELAEELEAEFYI